MTRIESKCGKYSVDLIKNGGHDDDIIAVACSNSFDSETMSNSSYWFTIGYYKSINMAIKQARKKMAAHNIELVAV